KVELPGSYKLVDHSILRAFNKGAIGELKVEGPENKAIYSGKQAESEYHVAKATAHTAAPAKSSAAPSSMPSGESLYRAICMGCHEAEGQGMPGTFPPLAKSDYLMADKARSISTVVNGHTGRIEVNGQSYNGVMPPMGNLKDDEIASILSYVRNS